MREYAAVLATYGQRIRSSLIAMTVLVIGVVTIVGAMLASPKVRMHDGGFVMAAQVIAWMYLLWWHFVEQMTSRQRRIIPNYAQAHVSVFLLFAVVAGAAWAAASLRSVDGPLVLIAVGAVLFAVIGWWLTTRSWVLLCISVAAYFGLVFGTFPKPVIDFLVGRHPTLALFLLAAGVITTGTLIWRLATVDEEDRSFGRAAMEFAGSGFGERMTGDSSRAWKAASQRGLFRWLNSGSGVYLPKNNGRWEHIRRWRGTPPGTFKFIIVLAFFWFGVAGVQAWESGGGQPPFAAMPFAIMFFMFISIGGVSHAWLRQWRFLEVDFLKPIDRGTFLKEIGLAMALDALLAWALFAVGMVIVLLITSANQARAVALLDAEAENAFLSIHAGDQGPAAALFSASQAQGAAMLRAQADDMARIHSAEKTLAPALIPASFFFQIFLYGVAVWEMKKKRHSEPILILTWVAEIVTILLMVPLFGGPLIHMDTAYCWAFLPLSLLFALLGVLLIRKAYRQWLVTELG